MNNAALVTLGCVLTFALAATPGLSGQVKDEAAPAGNVDNGKRLFTANGCYSCHNYDGSGGRHGPRLSQGKRTAAAFVAYVRKPSGTMPAYSAKVMSDQELIDVWAHLRTLPSPPPLSAITILNP